MSEHETICTCGQSITFTGSRQMPSDLIWRHANGFAAIALGQKNGVIQSHFAKPKRWWRRWDKRVRR